MNRNWMTHSQSISLSLWHTHRHTHRYTDIRWAQHDQWFQHDYNHLPLAPTKSGWFFFSSFLTLICPSQSKRSLSPSLSLSFFFSLSFCNDIGHRNLRLWSDRRRMEVTQKVRTKPKNNNNELKKEKEKRKKCKRTGITFITPMGVMAGPTTMTSTKYWKRAASNHWRWNIWFRKEGQKQSTWLADLKLSFALRRERSRSKRNQSRGIRREATFIYLIIIYICFFLSFFFFFFFIWARKRNQL